jgi:hypothetical protein
VLIKDTTSSQCTTQWIDAVVHRSEERERKFPSKKSNRKVVKLGLWTKLLGPVARADCCATSPTQQTQFTINNWTMDWSTLDWMDHGLIHVGLCWTKSREL